MRTREEHLAWCKERALAYLAMGDVRNAISSMLSDLKKHDETQSTASSMGMVGLMYAMHNDFDGARSFIEGFR